MYVAYTPEAQIFVQFALRRAAFDLQPNLGKVYRTTPKYVKVKGTHMDTVRMLEAQLFVRFTLR